MRKSQEVKVFLKKYFTNSRYKRNVLVLGSGRIIAQLLPILVTPLLTRCYSPNDFGIFGVYITIVTIFSMVSNGRYCLAILLPKKDTEARELVIISSVCSFLVSLIFTMVIVFKGEYIFSLFNVPLLNEYKILIGLSVLFVALYEAIYYYALRNKKYKIIARNVVIQAIILITIRLFGGYSGFTESGLMVSFLIGYIVAYFLLLLALKIKFKGIMRSIKFKKILLRYVKFPKFSLLADLLSRLAEMFPNIGMNMVFGNSNAGYLAMSDKILGSPLWFVTSSVGDVFKQEASEQYREKGSCSEIFIKTSQSLFLLGIIPFLLIFLLVPSTIPFLLGDEWVLVGQYIQIFCIMFFARFVVTPVSYVVYIVNKQNMNIFFQGLKFFVVVISFIVGYYTHNLKMTLMIWSLLTTLCYLVIYLTSLRLSKGSS
ncbi:oligosaccharide flippase family protein [bacterium]|nr:oligosaccharide flippase family protein [bacterium]